MREELTALRDEMKKQGFHGWYVPTNDFHGSEYVGDYFKVRTYLSGFTGSAGILVVLQDQAGLWTDGRYFLQAEEQLAGSDITLYKMGEEGVPTVMDFLCDNMESGQCLGMDGRMVDAVFAQSLKMHLGRMGVSIKSNHTLVDAVWKNRPALSREPVWELSITYAGVNRAAKIQTVCEWMKKKMADCFVLSSLDDIAWLLNLRGNDIAYNPVFLSYLVMSKEEILLFCQKDAFSKEVEDSLKKDGISLREYNGVYDYLKQIPAGYRVALDRRIVNYEMLHCIPKEVRVLDVVNPTMEAKAVKNPVEIENEKQAHIKDGVAVTKFIFWLKENVTKMPLTEISVAEKLDEFRKMGDHYLGQSFAPIAGYGEHGAIVHYDATKGGNVSLQPENFLLVDSGGQYLEGTTDITRTILLGKNPTSEQKKYYTTVLKGNLKLAAAKFKYGCSGVALDCLARQDLWNMGCDFNHGTGHGVGYLLNVHESPNAFRYKIIYRPGENAVLEEGMITSDEPGIYLAGKFGIRLENLILCVKKEKTEFGEFMGFETLTMVPFDRDAVDANLMDEKEKQLFNDYQRTVYETISPYLSRIEAAWLQDECEPVM